MHNVREKIIFIRRIIMILAVQLFLFLHSPEPYFSVNIQMIDVAKVSSTKEEKTSNKAVRLTLKQLQKKFTDGKYWNHADDPGCENVYNTQDFCTSIPCMHKDTIGTDRQTCNGFQPEDSQLSWQCMGYAEKLGYDATGYNPRLNKNGWYTDRRITAIDSLKPGDIVRYCNDGHSIYITGVDGDNVTYTDCNSDGCCIIKWNRTTTKSVLKNTFSYVRVAPFEVKENNISITKAKVKLSKTTYIYNGKIKKPTVKVELKGKKLKNGTDYTVTYKKTKNIGKGKVIITGIGDYEGTITKYINITAKAGTIFSVKGYQYCITSVPKATVTFCGVLSQTFVEITIPETIKYGGVDFKVTIIGNGALKDNTSITKVMIGDNVKIIGDYAFYGCTNLENIDFGSSVTTIGDSSFSRCIALTSVVLPENLLKIDKKAFCNSRNLKEIKIEATDLKQVGKDIFKGISSNAKIKVPENRFTTYRKLLQNKGQVASVTILKY